MARTISGNLRHTSVPFTRPSHPAAMVPGGAPGVGGEAYYLGQSGHWALGCEDDEELQGWIAEHLNAEEGKAHWQPAGWGMRGCQCQQPWQYPNLCGRPWPPPALRAGPMALATAAMDKDNSWGAGAWMFGDEPVTEPAALYSGEKPEVPPDRQENSNCRRVPQPSHTLRRTNR